MIQRAQTVYLALAFVCMVLLLFFPIFSVEIKTPDNDMLVAGEFGKDGVVGSGLESGSLGMYWVFIGLALLSMAGIFLYKKRRRQLLVTRLNFVLHLLLVIGVYAFYYFGKSFLASGVGAAAGGIEVEVTFFMELGFFLLIPTVAFIYLAIRGIKRDENLINSLDRLR